MTTSRAAMPTGKGQVTTLTTWRTWPIMTMMKLTLKMMTIRWNSAEFSTFWRLGDFLSSTWQSQNCSATKTLHIYSQRTRITLTSVTLWWALMIPTIQISVTNLFTWQTMAITTLTPALMPFTLSHLLTLDFTKKVLWTHHIFLPSSTTAFLFNHLSTGSTRPGVTPLSTIMSVAS